MVQKTSAAYWNFISNCSFRIFDMFLKVIVFLLLNILYESFAESRCPLLYEKGRAIAHHEKHKNERRYQNFNISEHDFEHIFNLEETPPSTSNRRADVLIEYLRLVKKKSKTFHSCLHKDAWSIPLEYRCKLPPQNCDAHAKYTRIDGYCNNLKTPNLGSHNIAYGRLLNGVYSDGVKEFRKTKDGKNLPNVRQMSNLFDKASKFKCDSGECGQETNNIAGLFFAQEVAHDTSDRNVKQIIGNLTNGIRCCDWKHKAPLPQCAINPDCKTITVPKDDKFYAPLKIFCLNYVRMQSTLNIDCSVSNDNQNRVTSFLDLNPIYGRTIEQLKKLRGKSRDGQIDLDPLNLMPLDDEGNLTTGDGRATQTPGLAYMHIMFYRMHNRFATELKQLNPHWCDYRLFWESRRILIACYQHIIYYDWLKVVLSADLIKQYKLNCLNYSNCEKYDETVDPSTFIEYSSNAFRWYHTNVPDFIHLVDDCGKFLEKIPLSDTYLKLDLLKTRLKDVVNGHMAQGQRMRRAGYSDEIRNLFFKIKYRGRHVGLDVFSIDMMRARDDGSPPYIYYFPKCVSTHIKHWCDLKPFFEYKHYKLLQKLYKHIWDIELFAGVLLEKRCNNLMGPIGGCLVAQQFHNLRFGDRFFYSHPNIPYKFTPGQLQVIRNSTFAVFMCMSSGVKQVPIKGFEIPSKTNPYVTCSDVGTIRLDSFKEIDC